MGIALSGSKEGDIVVELQTDHRIIWLTLREEELLVSSTTGDTSPSRIPSEANAGQPTHNGTFRLVGEAYIHRSNLKPSRTRDMQ